MNRVNRAQVVLEEKPQGIFVFKLLAHLFTRGGLVIAIIPHCTVDSFGSSFFTTRYSLTRMLIALCCFKFRNVVMMIPGLRKKTGDTEQSQKVYIHFRIGFPIVLQCCYSIYYYYYLFLLFFFILGKFNELSLSKGTSLFSPLPLYSKLLSAHN